MGKFEDIKIMAHQANLKLPELNLVVFTFGNASAMDREQGVFAIKPSGVKYELLQVEDMVVCDLDAKVVEGTMRPSSDTKTHAVLYKNWDHIGGIVHTHSSYATSWAQSQRDIPIYGTTHADYLAQDIPCAPPMQEDMIRGDYEYQTGIQILNEFEGRALSSHEVEMILVGNHAPFTWGKDVEQAVYNSAILEELARMAWLTEQINPEAPRLNEPLIEKHYTRKHGPDSYYGQSNR